MEKTNSNTSLQRWMLQQINSLWSPFEIHHHDEESLFVQEGILLNNELPEKSNSEEFQHIFKQDNHNSNHQLLFNTNNNHTKELENQDVNNNLILAGSNPKKLKTQVGVDNIAISKSSEYSLFDWFNYWFRGITLSVTTFGAVSNPHQYIEKQGALLPDRLSHDFYSRIYRFNKEEYVDAIANAKDDGHAPLTHNYEDCMQLKRGLTIFGTYTGAILGSAFAYAKNFGTIINRRRYLPYTLSGLVIGATLFRFVIAPRTESCFEQIINQALSERIISKGYNNMMEYYKQNEKPKIVNWNEYELEKEQQDYLNTKMREHMLNAMKKAGCNKESIESFSEGNELTWKQHLDANFKREYPSHRKYFKFL